MYEWLVKEFVNGQWVWTEKWMSTSQLNRENEQAGFNRYRLPYLSEVDERECKR